MTTLDRTSYVGRTQYFVIMYDKGDISKNIGTLFDALYHLEVLWLCDIYRMFHTNVGHFEW